jgi:hypothetical protein
MARNKTYPGPQVVSKRCIVRDALVSSGAGAQFGLMQPANSIIEKIYVRVLKAPLIVEGDIGIEVGTETSTPFDNIIVNTTDDNNLLDGGVTIPINVLYELTAATANTTWVGQGLATGDASSETASNMVTENTPVNFQFTTSTAVSTNGDFEVSFVFRVFE